MQASRLAFLLTLLLLPLIPPGPSFAQLAVEQLQPPGGVAWDKVDRKQPEVKVEQLNSMIQDAPKKIAAAVKATVHDLVQPFFEAVFWGCLSGAVIGCVVSHIGIHLLLRKP